MPYRLWYLNQDF